jgi:RimJ/RimL family protein N-acetyltransferase
VGGAASAQPVLRTARLILRPFEAGDAPEVERLAGAREIADTTLSVPHPYPSGGAASWIATHPARWAERSDIVYAITLAATGELIGAMNLAIAPAHSRAELGYWIGLPWWNNGYCTEAARAFVAFGFDTLGLHRIEARHFVRNPASGRVLVKLGMRFEGVHRDAVRKWERFEDMAYYGRLVTDGDDTAR